jgi:hypothetical protein
MNGDQAHPWTRSALPGELWDQCRTTRLVPEWSADRGGVRDPRPERDDDCHHATDRTAAGLRLGRRNHVLLASGINRRQLGIRIGSFDVLTETSVASDVDAATIEAVETGGRFSPDGRWLAFLGIDLRDPKLVMTGHLVSTTGG